jgi:hypothetical protein
VGISTTAIAASTTSIYAALNSTASYQTTQNNSIAASTTTLQAEISAVGTSTNVTAAWQNDNFIGQVNGSQKVFTLSLTPSSTAAVECVLDGLTLGTSDYSYTAPTTITVTTAPASNSTGFWCRYTYNTSTAPAVAVLNSTQSFTAPQTFNDGFAVGTTTGTPAPVWEIMQSMDGVTQSSGTAVAIYMSANSGLPTDYEVFSTTNSTAGSFPMGILLDNNCAPKSYCRVAVHGLVRASQIDNGGCTSSNQIIQSSNRGEARASGSGNPMAMGVCVGTSANGGPGWIRLW